MKYIISGQDLVFFQGNHVNPLKSHVFWHIDFESFINSNKEAGAGPELRDARLEPN